MSDPTCSECGNREATFIVTHPDGTDEPMCDPCTAWYVRHAVPEPQTRPTSIDGSTP